MLLILHRTKLQSVYRMTLYLTKNLQVFFGILLCCCAGKMGYVHHCAGVLIGLQSLRHEAGLVSKEGRKSIEEH